jgi:hypothetical protein
LKFECTIQQLAGGQWKARHAGSSLGEVEVMAASREEALRKLRDELQYRMELCPCSGASGDQAELVVRS